MKHTWKLYRGRNKARFNQPCFVIEPWGDGDWLIIFMDGHKIHCATSALT